MDIRKENILVEQGVEVGNSNGTHIILIIFIGVLGGLINRGTHNHNRNRKSALKQAIVVLIKAPLHMYTWRGAYIWEGL